jgi:hypothetical protein
MDSYDRQTQKITAEAARRIALYALTELKNFKLLIQNLILEKTFGHTYSLAGLSLRVPEKLASCEAQPSCCGKH